LNLCDLAKRRYEIQWATWIREPLDMRGPEPELEEPSREQIKAEYRRLRREWVEHRNKYTDELAVAAVENLHGMIQRSVHPALYRAALACLHASGESSTRATIQALRMVIGGSPSSVRSEPIRKH